MTAIGDTAARAVSLHDAAPPSAGPTPRYRWVILFVVWLGFLMSVIDRLIWTTVSGVAAGSYGLSIAALGIFVTAFYVGYVVSNALTGLACDWIGPRRMLVIALVPLGLLTMSFGLTTSLAAGLVLQALMGLTAGADFTAGVKLITSWFGVSDRGRAMGLFMTATSLGVVATNAVVPRLLEYVAWPTVYLGAGLGTLALGVTCYVVLRDNPDGTPTAAAEWGDLRAMLRSRQFVFVTLAGLGGVWGTWGIHLLGKCADDPQPAFIPRFGGWGDRRLRHRGDRQQARDRRPVRLSGRPAQVSRHARPVPVRRAARLHQHPDQPYRAVDRGAAAGCRRVLLLPTAKRDGGRGGREGCRIRGGDFQLDRLYRHGDRSNRCRGRLPEHRFLPGRVRHPRGRPIVRRALHVRDARHRCDTAAAHRSFRLTTAKP